ncbi:MAG: threonine aldolase family protein, partial [Acetobacteraceae bacterium]|nr:threonine aldolase family protein [Acetobacteraceae bacterium]
MYTPPRPDPSLPPLRVNLYSDTQTKPSPAMKEAMMRAEVGDEQLGEDPAVNALCDRMAALLGKEAALFLPSGTMCNQIAILTHTRPGDEVLAHERSHIIMSEGGGPGALAGVMVNGLRGARGQFDAETLAASFRPRSRYAPPQTLVAVEQTANHGGGSVWPLDKLDEVAEATHQRGLATHMDGARLMNAVIASGTAASDFAQQMDSVWLDFTKGLGAPRGAVICGPASFIDTAWRWKQR